MDNPTRSRAELKSYFVKNSIPTERNFADMIDGMLNQKDDGLVKLPGNPLSIEAAGDAASEKKALHIYASFGDQNPAWMLSLNPRSTAADPATAKLGLGISDGDGRNRLFIDRTSGNLGVGTTSPIGKLSISNVSTQANTPGQEVGQIAFVGFNRTVASAAIIAQSPSWDDQSHLLFKTSQDGAGAQERLRISSTGNVGIGTANPAARLDVQQANRTGNHPTAVKGVYVTGDFGSDNDGIEFRHSNGTQGIGFGYATLYATGSNTDQDLGLKARGTGKVRVASALQVSGAITPSVGNTANAGITFPNDPFTGAGDVAWMRYHNARGGEKGTLEIGIANDADDHIVLLPSGNVGIGITDPAEALEVDGRIKAGALTIGPWPANAVYAFFGTNAIDQKAVGNYALLQGSTGDDQGVTYLNSPANIRLRIGNADKLILANNGNLGVGAIVPAAKVTIQTPDNYNGHTIRFETRSEPARYFLNLNTVVTDSVVRWVFDQQNAGTNYPTVLAFDRGQIGIGTATPAAKLDVNGEIRLTGNITTRRAILNLGTTDGSQANANEVVGGIGFWGFGRQHGMLSFRVNNGFEMVDHSSGGPNLTYARDSVPYADLKLRNLTQTSSRDSKDHISDLSSQEAFAALAGLNAVTFSYRNDTEQQLHAGFIAEDSPDLVVSPDKKGIHSMDIVAILTKVVQEQQQMIAALEQKLV